MPAPQPTEDADQVHAWSRRKQEIAVVVWSSFLSASIATMVYFAFMDPLSYAEHEHALAFESRMTAYAVGFFFFWLVAMIAAALTALLLRAPASKPGGPP
jgi:hypothetical protein